MSVSKPAPSSDQISVEDFPGPHALPLLGNAFDINRADPLAGLAQMAKEYGPIFRLITPVGHGSSSPGQSWSTNCVTASGSTRRSAAACRICGADPEGPGC